jgi:DNA-binding transcriptional regulator GbsR (MarR family)
VNRRNEYTDTVRDLKALIRREAADDKRQALTENVDKMAAQLERQRDQLVDLKVLTERVDGLVWLVRGVVVATALEVVAGIVVALMLKGHP